MLAVEDPAAAKGSRGSAVCRCIASLRAPIGRTAIRTDPLMSSHGSRQPSGWDEHNDGRSSSSSAARDITAASQLRDTEPGEGNVWRASPRQGSEWGGRSVRPRRSSLSVGLDTLRRAGGVNSIENFARSWQRAAGFYEVTPLAKPLRLADDEDDDAASQSSDIERGEASKSLLRPDQVAEDAAEDGDGAPSLPNQRREGDDDDGQRSGPARRSSRRSASARDELLGAAPHLASSYGTSFGSLTSRMTDHSVARAGQLWREHLDRGGGDDSSKEREPLLVRRVEREDGQFVNVVVGQSTLPQTIFNSVNVLIGVGLLSLPLGIRHAGWLIGIGFLLLSAAVTAYTARILARCLDVDDTLITFADLAYISFGPRARVLTSILFGLELLAANVALVVLFADSLVVLIPGWGHIEWKIVCCLLLLPLAFLPLRVLSFSSVLGIVSCFGIVAIVFVDGLIKPHRPGSLREPAQTYLLPQQWGMLPIAFGLLMSPWGGHSVFPNIYRDMRHPKKFPKGLRVTYIFTLLLDLAMAVAGVLMFGNDVRDEMTSNILASSAYPRTLSVCIIVFIAIIPLTKIPLNARPIISTIEVLTGLDGRAVSDNPSLIGFSGMSRGLLRVTIRVLTMVIFVAMAIVFPFFDRVMALLGSAMCFTICVILPLLFYLRIFGRDIPLKERILDYVLIVVSAVLAVVGTVWVFLPW